MKEQLVLLIIAVICFKEAKKSEAQVIALFFLSFFLLLLERIGELEGRREKAEAEVDEGVCGLTWVRWMREWHSGGGGGEREKNGGRRE